MLYAGSKRLVFAIPVSGHRWQAIGGELTYAGGHLCSVVLDNQGYGMGSPVGMNTTLYILGEESTWRERMQVTEMTIRNGQNTSSRVVDQHPEIVSEKDPTFSKAC